MAKHQEDAWNPGRSVNPVDLVHLSRLNPPISHQRLW